MFEPANDILVLFAISNNECCDVSVHMRRPVKAFAARRHKYRQRLRPNLRPLAPLDMIKWAVIHTK